jgi:hypothetical protein
MTTHNPYLGASLDPHYFQMEVVNHDKNCILYRTAIFYRTKGFLCSVVRETDAKEN